MVLRSRAHTVPVPCKSRCALTRPCSGLDPLTSRMTRSKSTSDSCPRSSHIATGCVSFACGWRCFIFEVSEIFTFGRSEANAADRSMRIALSPPRFRALTSMCSKARE